MSSLTQEVSDSLTISESLAREGNNVKMGLEDEIDLEATLTSAYKIIRTGDTAFVRTNIP